MTPIVPKGDKVARAHAITPMFEQGVVAAMSDGGTFRAPAEMVIEECVQFPNGASDDLVDSLTMALRWFRDGGLNFFSEDESEVQPYRERVPLY